MSRDQRERFQSSTSRRFERISPRHDKLYPMIQRRVYAPLLLLLPPPLAVVAQTAPKITSPKDFLGFNIGDDYMMASYTQLDAYWHKIASECDRCKLVDIGPTEEGGRQ